jgi:hypothetical protein
MRSIGAWSHGIIDYLMVVFLAIAPSAIGFGGRQAGICYLLAIVHLALSLLTRYPLGAVKVVGFPLHGAIEFLVGVLLIILPWLANFARGVLSRNFFVGFGLLILLIFALTDYRGLRGRAAAGAAPKSVPPAR